MPRADAAVPGQHGAAEPAAQRTVGTFEVFVAGVALVVASTTLVSDFQGYFALGLSFAVAILLAFGINLLLGLSVAELAVDHPRAGALYEYGRSVAVGSVGRFVGVFLAFAFAGMFVFAGAGETAAGAFGLQALFNTDANLNWFIVVLAVAAVVPNLFGVRTAAWVSAVLLVGMLGIRWWFGLAGLFGLSSAGPWAAANLDTGGPGALEWFGAGGLLAGGLVLGFWTFVGIEFVAPLVEEVRRPRRQITVGIVVGLVVILLTSWLMGLGVAGTTPASGGTWAEVALGEGSLCAGSCPQLVVGEEMFGGTGRGLMALASVMATLGSMTVAFAAVPLMLQAVAREGMFFGPLSRPVARLHPRWGTPVTAILVFAVASTTAALFSADVVEWVFAGAYVWLLLYAVYHVLVVVNRVVAPSSSAAVRRPDDPEGRLLLGGAGIPLAVVGFVTTLLGLYYAFLGAHAIFLPKAGIVLGVALLAAAVAVVTTTDEPTDTGPHLDIDLTERPATAGARPTTTEEQQP